MKAFLFGLIAFLVTLAFSQAASGQSADVWSMQASATDLDGQILPRLYSLHRTVRVDVLSNPGQLATSASLEFDLSGPLSINPGVGDLQSSVAVHLLELDAPGPLPPYWGYNFEEIDPTLPGHSGGRRVFGGDLPPIVHMIARPQQKVRLLIAIRAYRVLEDGTLSMSYSPNLGEAQVKEARTPVFELESVRSRSIVTSTMSDCGLVEYSFSSPSPDKFCGLTSFEAIVNFDMAISGADVHFLRDRELGSPSSPPATTDAELSDGTKILTRQTEWGVGAEYDRGISARRSEIIESSTAFSRIRFRYQDPQRLFGFVVLVVPDQLAGGVDSVLGSPLGTFTCRDKSSGCSFGTWAGSIQNGTPLVLLALAAILSLLVLDKRARQ